MIWVQAPNLSHQIQSPPILLSLHNPLETRKNTFHHQQCNNCCTREHNSIFHCFSALLTYWVLSLVTQRWCERGPGLGDSHEAGCGLNDSLDYFLRSSLSLTTECFSLKVLIIFSQQSVQQKHSQMWIIKWMQFTMYDSIIISKHTPNKQSQGLSWMFS